MYRAANLFPSDSLSKKDINICALRNMIQNKFATKPDQHWTKLDAAHHEVSALGMATNSGPYYDTTFLVDTCMPYIFPR
jgi:hypothetical protein